MGSIGNLDQRVTFQANTRSSDGGGGNTTSWADFASIPTVWADVVALSGSEISTESGISATGRYKVTIRNRSDINEDDRIVWNGENYNIRNVRRMGSRKMYLVLDVERGVAD